MAICYVVISVATYVPTALCRAGGLLALHCQLSCKLLDSYWAIYASKMNRDKGRYQKQLVTHILLKEI